MTVREQALADFDRIKTERAGRLRYRLANANVYVSPKGFHFIDYLDPVETIDPRISGAGLTPEEIGYIERQLQFNAGRFEHQVDAVRRFLDPAGRRVLDVGCGGGLFLTKMRDLGAKVTGLELSDTRAAYAQTRHGLDVIKRPVEDPYWENHHGTFDVVTLWDVIEHVNAPAATLEAATKLLRPGGMLFIDTPCRDAFYHRCGEVTYRMSGGRYPTFLDAMYSAHLFGHKQIFSIREMTTLYAALGLEVLISKTFHELSFPKEFYLRKLLRSEAAARVLAPVASLLLAIVPIRNKMLVAGRKP